MQEAEFDTLVELLNGNDISYIECSGDSVRDVIAVVSKESAVHLSEFDTSPICIGAKLLKYPWIITSYDNGCNELINAHWVKKIMFQEKKDSLDGDTDDTNTEGTS